MSGRIVIHADEACLGNGSDPPNPGGAGGLVEVTSGGAVHRRDFSLAEPDTTNNRMALRSAMAALSLLAPGHRRPILFVSDSNYLVRGMNEWLRGWKARGWKRKEGTRLVPVANEELWRELDAAAEDLDITWRWVRGHAGHPKNEYANFLATRAAREQRNTDGLVPSEFLEWLAAERMKERYTDFREDALED